jgi:hypothetical protein
MRGQPGYDRVVGDMVPAPPSDGEMWFEALSDKALNVLMDYNSFDYDELSEAAQAFALDYAGVTPEEWVRIEDIDEDPRGAAYFEGKSRFWTRVLVDALRKITFDIANRAAK